MKIRIGITSRHIHLSQLDLDILFGLNYELSKINDLTQDNSYSCCETVDIYNNDYKIKNVRVVGPVRNGTQLEITKTDAYNLKINPPLAGSGNLDDASLVKIVGPAGEVERKCAIIQQRHIHMTSEFISNTKYKNGDIVKVRLFGEKGGIIENVHIKVTDGLYPELHLDLDDSNAHLVRNDDYAEILED